MRCDIIKQNQAWLHGGGGGGEVRCDIINKTRHGFTGVGCGMILLTKKTGMASLGGGAV